MSKDKKIFFELEDISLKCEEVASLAFVIWDAFANGSEGIDAKRYESVLRLMMDHAEQLNKDFRDRLNRLYDEKEGGAGS